MRWFSNLQSFYLLIIGIGLTAIENNIRFLEENRYIE